MASFSGKFESSRQDWETPDSVFGPLAQEFAFTLDVAATADNTKAPAFYTESDDGLAQAWHGICWCNPPYGAGTAPLSAWVKKALQESRIGATVVMLIPARTNTNWFHDCCLAHGEVRFLRGRPKFGGADHGLPQPLCIVVFRAPQKEPKT